MSSVILLQFFILTELLQLNTIAIYSSIKLIKLHRPVKHIFLFFLKG